jgi:hypothetical protein
MSIIDFISVLLLASLLLVFWAFHKGRKLACLLKFMMLIALVSSATADDDIALASQHPVLLPVAQYEQRYQDVAAEHNASICGILLFLYGNYSNGSWVWGNVSA